MSILSDNDRHVIEAVVKRFTEWEKERETSGGKYKDWSVVLDDFLKENNFKLDG